MLRRVLTYQLILAVAVGPLLCCCTTGRLLGSVAAPPAAAPTSLAHSPASTSRVTTRCCGHTHKSTKLDADREAGDPKPAPTKPGEKCPCKDDSGKSATNRAEVISFDVTSFLRTAVLHLLTLLAVVDGTDYPTQDRQWSDTSRGWNAALPSTADLLYAHHNLRC